MKGAYFLPLTDSNRHQHGHLRRNVNHRSDSRHMKHTGDGPTARIAGSTVKTIAGPSRTPDRVWHQEIQEGFRPENSPLRKMWLLVSELARGCRRLLHLYGSRSCTSELTGARTFCKAAFRSPEQQHAARFLCSVVSKHRINLQEVRTRGFHRSGFNCRLF